MTNEKKVYKLKKSSAYSYSVTIPKEVVDKYGCPPASPERA